MIEALLEKLNNNINLVQCIVQISISLVAIGIPAIIAIVAIRKTAKESRISSVHNYMVDCIIDSIRIINRPLKLLEGISNKVFYERIPERDFIETAYDRYWREIKLISEEFSIIQNKQKFLLPNKLYRVMQKLINRLNEAREESKHLMPKNKVYPDTDDLKTIIKEANKLYVEFVNTARGYIGIDNLASLKNNNIGNILQHIEGERSDYE